jgi:hypothetical protein
VPTLACRWVHLGSRNFFGNCCRERRTHVKIPGRGRAGRSRAGARTASAYITQLEPSIPRNDHKRSAGSVSAANRIAWPARAVPARPLVSRLFVVSVRWEKEALVWTLSLVLGWERREHVHQLERRLDASRRVLLGQRPDGFKLWFPQAVPPMPAPTASPGLSVGPAMMIHPYVRRLQDMVGSWEMVWCVATGGVHQPCNNATRAQFQPRAIIYDMEEEAQTGTRGLSQIERASSIAESFNVPLTGRHPAQPRQERAPKVPA